MILTCSRCATSYTVDAAKIPPEGRTVKCANCGFRWSAEAEALMLDEDVAVNDFGRDQEPFLDQAAGFPTSEPDFTDLSAAEGPEIPKVYRAKKADERKVRQAAATGIIWAGMAATLVVILALAAVFRINVVGLWPKSAAAYAWVGLPVNSLGLTIEGIEARPALQDGHAALSVSGVLRNVKDRAIEAPPLRVSLLNKAGKSVATKIARPADAVVPAGETRHFSIALLDPPLSASQLEVAFAPEAGHKAGPGSSGPHEAVHSPVTKKDERGPALHASSKVGSLPPHEVKPLPESSPYALSPHG